MNKVATDQLVEQFYKLGSQLALSSSNMEKNALFGPKVSLNAIRKALSAGPKQSAILSAAASERLGGQLGTLGGGLGGAAMYGSLANHVDPMILFSAGLPMGAAMTGGSAYLANAIGRNVGKGLGGLQGAIRGLAPFRATGNLLADPFKQVPGIRG